MAELFDTYRANYSDVVGDSVRFSGLKHDFFLAAKAEVLARIMAERGLEPPQTRALDVGCGIGSLHPYLGGFFASLDGCDVSTESIERATEEHPGNRYQAYVPPRLPYDDASFDLAFASCVVHHVPPEGWAGFFAEFKRVVRPGGAAVIIEHNPLNPLTRLAVYRCPFDEDAVLLRPGKVARLFKAAGFTEHRCEHFLLLPTAHKAARRLERALSATPLGAQYACSARA